jgi:hypothetical protein
MVHSETSHDLKMPKRNFSVERRPENGNSNASTLGSTKLRKKRLLNIKSTPDHNRSAIEAGPIKTTAELRRQSRPNQNNS